MGFCPYFDQIKTFGGAVAPPAPPPHTPVVLRDRHGLLIFLTVSQKLTQKNLALEPPRKYTET